MVKNPEILKDFEEEYIRNDKRTYAQKLKRFNEMYEHAKKLGIVPGKNRLEGIEVKIKVAKIVNGL
ncbi:MAG: hypothetical protein J0M18_12100 [Ignavibacteria bacterium]|jgi:hypothetical protein|nr:hypothetical protein [Ignavibacteria bacterium]